MTIAAGFLCVDGIVLCADSQHTGSMTKFDQKKIIEIPGKDGSWLVITGAGYDNYIAMAVDSLEERFEKCSSNFSAIKDIIKETITEIYEQHIWKFPSGWDVPTIELLVAARLASGEVRLWQTAFTSVSTCRQSAFIGMGAEIAQGLASWIYPNNGGYWRMTQIIAKEILAETKRISKECGGMTHVCSIPVGNEGIRGVEVRTDSEFFGNLNYLLGRVLRSVLDKRDNESTFQGELKIFEEQMQKMRDLAQDLPDGREWLMMFHRI
ncbi:MAG TPA: hypothetical protein VHA33_13895 [Candidatus Angelobacter sp.]|jgi:20S proteasome alpha/beta subunit|nr:hypothetical protein [Candidatus Angelobacter sp.]